MSQPLIISGENAAAKDTPAMTLAQTASACERMLAPARSRCLQLYESSFPPSSIFPTTRLASIRGPLAAAMQKGWMVPTGVLVAMLSVTPHVFINALPSSALRCGSVACPGCASAHLRSLRTLRGGSSPAAATKKNAPALGERQLERLFGKPHSLDLKVAHNRATLVKLIKEHRLGGGEFHMVTLDGKDFHVPGTKKTDDGPSAHFTDMGINMGKSAKGELKGDVSAKVNAAKAAFSAATEYKGLQYSEAELNKLPKAEAEYRRELMARSKQAVKMEMGFESGLKAGLDVYKSVMQRFGSEDTDKAGITAADAWESQLPTKGVLQFRYRSKELQVTGSGDKTPEKASWAAQRASALNRARGAAAKTEQAAAPARPWSERMTEVVSFRFVAKKVFGLAWSVGSAAVAVAAWAWDSLRGLVAGSPKASAMRAARAAALS